MTEPDTSFETVRHAILERKTEKALCDIERPLEAKSQSALAQELLELAHWAPFHKPAHETHRQTDLNSVVPWRMYVLEAQDCRKLLSTFKEWSKDDPSWLEGKIPNLLASADLLFQVTWLPNPKQTENQNAFEGTKDNMEHIAAAASAVQNILIGATAKGLPNYWASGGLLLRPEIFKLLGISQEEMVLGSIFIFPKHLGNKEQVKIVPGSWREKRGPIASWSKKLDIV